DVHPAVGASGEVPQGPGVGVAEQQVAGLSLVAGAVDVVQDPLHLRAGEVGGQGQTTDVLVLVRALVTPELGHDLVGAGVLPDDRVVGRLTSVLVPHHGRLALVGDADRRQVAVGDGALAHRLADHLTGVVPDLSGVVL